MIAPDGAARRAEITHEIRAAGDQARAADVARRRHGAYFWLVMVSYMILAPAGAVLLSRQIALNISHQSERKLCGVVAMADDAWRVSKPTTPSGKAQAAAMAKLRHDYRCP
jgi:hypothetical protein